MKEVFLLEHVREFAGVDDVKLIGVYSTRALGQEALQRAKQFPGFRATPDGLHLDCYRLDEDHWTEGYFTST